VDCFTPFKENLTSARIFFACNRAPPLPTIALALISGHSGPMAPPDTQTPVGTQDRLAESLELLADMGRDFVGSRDVDGTLLRALERITSYLDAEGSALFLLEDEGRILRCQSCVGATEITGLTLKSDHGIVGRSVQTDSGEIVRDVSQDPNFDSSVDKQTGYTTRSILCAPLSVQGERLGAIELINKKGGDGLFSEDDLHVLEVLANSAALAILNARMAEELVEQESVRRELELAAEIQRNLLPGEPGDESVIRGINIPARTVSGDFYDFFELPDGRLIFCLGDVSGKGINAALLMAKTASLFRCLGKTVHSPGKLLGLVNSEICETSTRGMFVTMAAGIFDPETDTVCIANAGHEPPLFIDGTGGTERFEAEAPPIGISPQVVPEEGYPEVCFPMADGALYIFTDGVTEGTLEDGSMLELEGVLDVINGQAGNSLAQKLQALADKINWGDGHLHDDLTILGLSPSRGASHESDGLILQKSMQGKARNLKSLRSAVADALAKVGIEEASVNDIVLATDEACQNIIRHAYGGETEEHIDLQIFFERGRLRIYLQDTADLVNLDAIKPRDLGDIKPGGLGTHFINQIMDDVVYSHRENAVGNQVYMSKQVT